MSQNKKVVISQTTNAGGHLGQKSKYAHFSQVTEHNKELFPLFENAKPIRIIANPGECIFIPQKWWHWVKSHGDRCLSVNFWFDPQDNAKWPENPELIKNAISNWKAFERWDNDYLIRKIDDPETGIPEGLWLFLQDFAISKSVSLRQFVEKYGTGDQYAYLITPVDYEPRSEKRNGKILDILNEDFECPFPEKMTNAKANFWMNFGGIDTGLHFDDEPGILCVVEGTKEVLLYPPENSQFLYPYPLEGVNLKYYYDSFHCNLYKDGPRLQNVVITMTHLLEVSLERAPNVAKIAKSLQEQFGAGRIVYGIKNRSGVISFEFYFYGINRDNRSMESTSFYKERGCNPDFSLDSYMKVHKELFPNDKYHIIDLNMEGLCIFSIDLTEDTVMRGITPKLNLYYTTDVVVNLPFILTEKTLWQDGKQEKRCTVWTERFDTMFSHVSVFIDRCLKIGIKGYELPPIINFINGSPYKCGVTSIFNKGQEIGLYFYGVNYDAFIHFLVTYDYSVNLIELVANSKEDISQQQLEIGFHFPKLKCKSKPGAIAKPTRTAFYGLF